MIGLMIYGAIGLWLLVAFVLGYKIPLWLKLKPIWAWFFMPLIFFMPVMDEVIAWPQMQMLCHNIDGYKFAEGMNEKLAAGRRVYYTDRTTPMKIFPSTVKVEKFEVRYIDSVTSEIIFERSTFGVRHGWLSIPAGSNGHAMTAFLKSCPFDQSAYEKFKEKFKLLNITQVPTP